MGRGLSRLQQGILRMAWDEDRRNGALRKLDPSFRQMHKPGIGHEQVRQRFFSKRSAAAAASISRAAQRLEKRGLVRRVRGGGAGPARIALTPKGKRIAAWLVTGKRPGRRS